MHADVGVPTYACTHPYARTHTYARTHVRQYASTHVTQHTRTHARTHVHTVKLSVATIVVMLPGDTPGYLYTNTGKPRTGKLQEAVHISEMHEGVHAWAPNVSLGPLLPVWNMDNWNLLPNYPDATAGWASSLANTGSLAG